MRPDSAKSGIARRRTHSAVSQSQGGLIMSLNTTQIRAFILAGVFLILVLAGVFLIPVFVGEHPNRVLAEQSDRSRQEIGSLSVATRLNLVPVTEARHERGMSLPFSIHAAIKGTCEPGVPFQIELRIDSLIPVEDARLVVIPEPGLSVGDATEVFLGDLSPRGSTSTTLDAVAQGSGTYHMALRVMDAKRRLHQRTLRINVLPEGGGFPAPTVSADSVSTGPSGMQASPQRTGGTEYTADDARMAAPRALQRVPPTSEEEKEQVAFPAKGGEVADDSDADELPNE